jgi:hypothetical protein
VQGRRELAGGEGATAAAEPVTRGAVDPEELAAAGQRLGILLEALGVLAVGGQLRAAADLLHVRRELLGLVLVELRFLLLGLRLLAGHRHAAGAHLELDRGRPHADEARAAPLDTLPVTAVTGDAAGVVELLAPLRDGGELPIVVGERTRRERGVNATG